MQKLTELESSHASLLGALTFAGMHIRALTPGRRDSPELALLRRVVREARRIAEKYESPGVAGAAKTRQTGGC